MFTMLENKELPGVQCCCCGEQGIACSAVLLLWTASVATTVLS